eukprot:11196262-Lingulodinium_polyedra.AAC.1
MDLANVLRCMRVSDHMRARRLAQGLGVSTFCSPEILLKGLWANKMWKRLRPTSCDACMRGIVDASLMHR